MNILASGLTLDQVGALFSLFAMIVVTVIAYKKSKTASYAEPKSSTRADEEKDDAGTPVVTPPAKRPIRWLWWTGALALVACLIFFGPSAYRPWSGPSQPQTERMLTREVTKNGLPTLGSKTIFVTRDKPQWVEIPVQCKLHCYPKGPIVVQLPSGKIIGDRPGIWQDIPEDGGLFKFWAEGERSVSITVSWSPR